MTPSPSSPWTPVLLNKMFAPKAHGSYGAQKGQQTDAPEVRGQTYARLAAHPGDLEDLGPVAGRLKVLGASPPFAGNKADVVGLTVGVHPPSLPPLLVTGVDYMQHIPKAKAQGLAQEAAVLGLVIVKQGPGRQRALGQSLAEDSSRPETQLRGSGSGVYSKAQLIMALPRGPWALRNPKAEWGPKALLLLIVTTTINCHSVDAVSAIRQAMDSVQSLK